MKILWFSNKILSERDTGGTGTWLDALKLGLLDSKIQLANIAPGYTKHVSQINHDNLIQWMVPVNAKLNPQTGLPNKDLIREIQRAVDNFSPTLIHIWGTERFWGLLSAEAIINKPVVLSMQGLIGAIAQVFNGGLSIHEQLFSIGVKELILGSSIPQERNKYSKWGIMENRIISAHNHISIQSSWMEAQVKKINQGAIIYENGYPLRNNFYFARPWKYSGKSVVFCSAAYPSPYKGLHIALRAIAIVMKRFPDVQLHIAGYHQKKGIRQDGYVAWLNKEAKRLNVESNIIWLGPLSSDQIINELQMCSAFIIPSFIESYCMALAEAMVLGVPSVVSFTGGTSYLARDGESALFFLPGDDAQCAYQIERLLTDQPAAERISRNAREVASVRNDSKTIISKQIDIYHQVLEGTA
jgi:glycosyltransferase involved in cell wall biosynthesis